MTSINGAGESARDSKIMQSRRKFIKKAAITSLVVSIPAQPVWGRCSVSGGVSGNASLINQDCVACVLHNGRSPGFWRDCDLISSRRRKKGRHNKGGMKLASAFPYLKQYKSSDDRFECAELKLKRLISETKNCECLLGQDRRNRRIYLNVADALRHPGGIAWNLAAVFLNCKFGFYDNILPIYLPSGDAIEDAEGLVAHLYGLDVISRLSSRDYGFTDGSTRFSLSEECV